MVKWVASFLFMLLMGCSGTSLKPHFDEVQYDFQQKSIYTISSKHKNIYISLDAPDLQLPAQPHRIKTLLLDWVKREKDAQFILFIRFSNSFLIERISGVRTEVEFDEKGRGRTYEIPIQRAYVRTHYTIELVDVLNDVLVSQYQGAGNYPIEAKLVKEKAANRKLLRGAFQDELGVARYQLMTDIWDNIKKVYLRDIQVTFGQQNFKLVSELNEEPAFLTAYDLLLENNKTAAQKALAIYNDAIKQYVAGESDRSDQIRTWLDQGITAASAIVNHEFDDRYPPE